MNKLRSRRLFRSISRIRRAVERLENRVPPSSIAGVLAATTAYESGLFINDLESSLTDVENENYAEIARHETLDAVLGLPYHSYKAGNATQSDEFARNSRVESRGQYETTVDPLATDQLMDSREFLTHTAAVYDDSVLQAVEAAFPPKSTAISWNENVAGAVTSSFANHASPQGSNSQMPYLGEGEGMSEPEGEVSNSLDCVVRLENPDGPIGHDQGESIEIINQFKIFSAIKSTGRVSIGDGGFSMKVWGWASAYYGPFFDTEENDISAAVNLVGAETPDGNCRIDYQEVGGSTWDYHASPLSLGLQANIRQSAEDTITVDFRGTVGAKGGGAVGAGVGDLSVGLDIPNTTLKATKTLRTSTTWKAYPIDEAPPLTPNTPESSSDDPSGSPSEDPPEVPYDIDLNDYPPFPG